MRATSSIKELTQQKIENTFSKKGIYKLLKEDVISSEEAYSNIQNKIMIQLHDYVSKKYYPSKNERITKILISDITLEDICLELFIIMSLKEVMPIQQATAKLGNFLNYDNQWDSIQTAAEIVGKCESTGLYQIIRGEFIALKSNIIPDKEVIDKINIMIYLPPSIVPIKPVTSNKELVLNEHRPTQQVSLDVINIANKVKLSLDTYTLQQEEKPNKELDTIDKIEQFNKLKQDSRRVYNLLNRVTDWFSFKHAYDRRGRLYNAGYHVSYQSTKYKLALISLNRKELIE